MATRVIASRAPNGSSIRSSRAGDQHPGEFHAVPHPAGELAGKGVPRSEPHGLEQVEGRHGSPGSGRGGLEVRRARCPACSASGNIGVWNITPRRVPAR